MLGEEFVYASVYVDYEYLFFSEYKSVADQDPVKLWVYG